MTATVIASRSILTAPSGLTPNIYDRGERIILDASRIQDVADGDRVVSVVARGTGSSAERTFNAIGATNGNLPKFRKAMGPNGVPCLDFDGTASIKNSGVGVYADGFYIAAMVKMDEWTAQSAQRLAARTDPSAGLSVSLALFSSTPSVRIFGGSLNAMVTMPLPSQVDTWQPLVVAWGADGQARIVFGEISLENTLEIPVATTLTLGAAPNADLSGGGGLKAKLAELRMGAGTLTLSEAQALAAMLREKYGV